MYKKLYQHFDLLQSFSREVKKWVLTHWRSASNSNKTGNPGKTVRKVFLSSVGPKKWYSYMVLGKKLKVFIGKLE